MPTAKAVGISACRKSLFLKQTSTSLLLSPCPLSPGKGDFTGATAPRPCRGLRPCDPIFRKYKGLSTVCNADGFFRRHFYMSEYACRRYLLTGDIQLDKAFKHGTFGINIVLAVFGKYFYSGEAHSYFVVTFGILYKDGML